MYLYNAIHKMFFFGAHPVSHLHIFIYTCINYTCFFFTGMLFHYGVELVVTLYVKRVRGVEQLHRERRSQKKKKGYFELALLRLCWCSWG